MKKKNPEKHTEQSNSILMMQDDDARQFLQSRGRLQALNALFDAARTGSSEHADINTLLDTLGAENKKRLVTGIASYVKNRAH